MANPSPESRSSRMLEISCSDSLCSDFSGEHLTWKALHAFIRLKYSLENIHRYVKETMNINC